jgi:hypothetical protein
VSYSHYSHIQLYSIFNGINASGFSVPPALFVRVLMFVQQKLVRTNSTIRQLSVAMVNNGATMLHEIKTSKCNALLSREQEQECGLAPDRVPAASSSLLAAASNSGTAAAPHMLGGAVAHRHTEVVAHSLLGGGSGGPYNLCDSGP